MPRGVRICPTRHRPRDCPLPRPFSPRRRSHVTAKRRDEGDAGDAGTRMLLLAPPARGHFESFVGLAIKVSKDNATELRSSGGGLPPQNLFVDIILCDGQNTLKNGYIVTIWEFQRVVHQMQRKLKADRV